MSVDRVCIYITITYKLCAGEINNGPCISVCGNVAVVNLFL